MYENTNHIKERESMAKAWMMMTTRNKLSADDFAILKKDIACHQSKLMKGYIQTKEHVEKRISPLRGKERSQETKDKISAKSGRSLSEKQIDSIIKKKGKELLQIDLNGNIIKEWKSKSTAAKTLGLDNASIGSCCRDQKRTLGGFKWRYKNNKTDGEI